MRATKFWTSLLSRHHGRPSAGTSEGPLLLCNAFRVRLGPGCVGATSSASIASPFSSSTGPGSGDSGQQQYPPNSSITPTFISNRNPRNLEKLRIGEKPDGWRLEKAGKSFWNKVTLDISSKHICASVVHFQAVKPISVSTKEWCIKKYLYSTNDASAAKLVGQVLARRCLQVGITEIACFFTEEERKKEKVNLFLKAIEDGGVALSEPAQVPPDWHVDAWNMPETPWDIHEGVDDNVLLARQLRGFTIRSRKKPNRKERFKELEEK